MSLLLDNLFSSILLAHMAVDFASGQNGILLAFLSIPLKLTNATVGLVGTLYSLLPALAQPIFGFIADRRGSRWVITGGVFWMMAFFSLAVIIPGRLALAFLVLASLGSGALHPAGSAEATLAGRNRLDGRETTAASLFFFFGQTGFFFGPLIGGPLLDRWGTAGLLVIALFGFPVSLYAGWGLRGAQPSNIYPKTADHPVNLLPENISWIAAAALILVAACQSWAQQNMNIFLPKYLADAGESASKYGFLAALFMGGSAVGNLVGGQLADHFGRRRVIFAGLAFSSLPLFLVGRLGVTPWLYLLVPLAGLLNGTTFTVIVVQAQNLIPGGMAMASGLALGFTFSAGALGALASGYLADASGFPPVFFLSAALGLLGAFAALFLQSQVLKPHAPMPSDIARPSR